MSLIAGQSARVAGRTVTGEANVDEDMGFLGRILAQTGRRTPPRPSPSLRDGEGERGEKHPGGGKDAEPHATLPTAARWRVPVQPGTAAPLRTKQRASVLRHDAGADGTRPRQPSGGFAAPLESL